MEDKINILNELKEAGAVDLINIDNKNCFFVPDGYFSTLSFDILSHVFIKTLPNVNPFTVPKRYFENLADAIFEKINHKNSQLSGIEKKNLYAVPEDYFNSFADNLLKKIKSSGGNSVQQELEEISPLLSKIPKIGIYDIPANYFAQLNPLEAAGENLKPAAKVISMGGKTRKWLNYAAAACIAAVLFGGGFFYFFKPAENKAITLTNADVQKQISLLSDAEISDYLEDNNNISIYTNTGTDDYQPQNLDIQSMLQNVSDEEIQQYLNEEPDLTKKGEGI